MKKNIKHSQHSVVFHERPLVVAVRHALPYIVGLSLAFSTVQHASSRSSESAAAFTATQLVRQFTLKNTVSQVSLGMQGYVVDVNGQQLGPAMGTAPSGWPADMGSVPTTVNLPRRDGAGRPLGYCAWDNSSTTPMTGYNVNDPDHPDLVYAVVSPGLNGTMQTSCAYILANGVGVGDDHVQVTAPIQISSVQYKSSVATFADLPAGKEGDVRLVRDTNKLYSYVGGTWGPIDGSKFSDDSATNGVGAIAYTTGKVTVADFQATTATFSGGVTANTFTGNGGGLTDLNAANFSSGVMAPQFGGTGVNASAAANGTLLIGNGSGFTLGTLTAGAGISVLNDAGAITISNSGVISITGTADQIITSANNGNVVLSLPQNIATNSIPTFGGMMLNGDLMGTNATFNGTVTMGSLAAQRLDVGTSAGGVTNPNLIIGIGAMPGAQSGNGGNSVLGVFALNANTSGELNTATGLSALRLNSTGSFNTANGFQSLLNNSTGYSNSAFGINSLVNTTTGFENAALGSSSGMANTTGSNNTFLGASADATSGALTFATAIGSNSRVATSNTMALGRNSVTDQIVIGTDTRNDTFVGTKLYVNGVTNLNGDLRGTTATFTGAVTANSFVGDGSGLTNLNASNFNSGILPVAQGGTGLDGSAAPNGSLLIGNGTGYTLNTLTGTADQINVTNGAGTITLSLPQSIATTSSPTFGGMVLNGNLAGTTATFGGAVTVDSLAAQRLNVGTTAGVLNPNLIIGNGAMIGVQSGDGVNTAVGIDALQSNTTGHRNAAIGYKALMSNTTGHRNLASGYVALPFNTTGYENTASGSHSLFNNTEGYFNTGTGYRALFLNTTGVGNTASGHYALYNTTGNNNAALGRNAGQANTTGSNNTFLGASADATSGALTFATAIGSNSRVATSNTMALGRNSVTDQIVIGTDTRNDTFVGTKLYVNGVTNLNGDLRGTTATFTGAVTANSFVGDGSGLTNLNASNFNSGILPAAQGGTGLDGSAAPNGSLLIGNGTGYTLNTLTGTADQINVTNGAGTITLSLPQSIATTSSPTFGGMVLNGNLAGTTATFGGAVTVDSLAAQRLNVGTTAGGVTNPNLIIGNGAMPGAQTGNGNNAVVGISALNQNTSGQRNTAVGNQALYANTTGSNNTANGFAALFSNTTGLTNVAIGNVALYGNTTGNNNVAVGNGAGYSTLGGVTTNANTTGGANTFLGSNAMPGTATPLFNATALGAEATVSTSNTLALGRNSVTDQIVIGTDTRNDTFAGTKLYVNGVTNLNGDLRGTTATFTGAVSANSFAGDGSGLTNLNASNFNSGILPVAQGGTGLDGSAAANGSLLIGNGTGYTLGTLTGTANQVNVTNGAGTITLSLPQNIATTSTPTFGGLTLNGAITGTTGTFSGAVTVDSLAAQRLNVGTLAGVSGRNLIIGINAMPSVQTGAGLNVAVGLDALGMNSSGNRNTAVGNFALFSNTTGLQNTASGVGALYSNTTGNNNVAVGRSAGYASQFGNTVNANITGGFNTFLGSFARPGSTDQLNYATALGSEATVSTSNTLALGRNSVTDQIVIGTDTRNDTFAGTKLYVNGVTNLNGDLRGTTATFTGAVSANSFAGDGSGLTNLNASNFNSGILPVAQGGTGLDGSAAANGSLLIGNGTGYTLNTLTGTANQVNVTNGAGTIILSLPQSIATTSSPTFGGMVLNGNLAGTTGTFTGAVTVDSLSAQRLNVGTSAGGVNRPNVIIGNTAMAGAQSGDGANTAVGINVLNANTTGSDNTGVGHGALQVNTAGAGNTAIGSNGLRLNTTGNGNTATGVNALAFSTTGSSNTAYGNGSLSANTTGSRNSAVGLRAGLANTTGSDNTFLGYQADTTSNALTFATVIGSGSTVATSNTMALGRNSVTDQIVIGTDTRNDTFAGTKLYVNGVTNLNGDLRGTTATFTGAVSANSFAGDGSGLTNLNASNFTTGILPVARGGTGLDGSAAANGSLLIGNGTGYTLNTLTGTANQINVTNGAGTITLSLPQSIATTSTPTFGGMTLNGALSGTTGAFSSSATVGGTLAVTGATTLTGAVTANSIINANAGLSVTTGEFIRFGGQTENTDTMTFSRFNVATDQSMLRLSFGDNNGGFNSSSGDEFQVGYTSGGVFTPALRVSGIGDVIVGRNITAGGSLTATGGTFTGAVTVDSLGAQRLNLGTSAGGVTDINLIIGNGAMPGAQSGGGANIAVGLNALAANTSGQWNTAIGRTALTRNTTGSDNIAIGPYALFNNTTGYSNIATGAQALTSNTTGFQNTASGMNSLYNTTTGSSNTASGDNTLFANTTGSNNVALGRSAGNTNTTGNDNTFLGYNANATSSALSFASAIGSGSTVATSNTMALGRNSVTDQIVIGTDTRNDTFAGTKLYVNGVTNLNGALRGTTANFTGRVDAASLFVNGVEVTGGGSVTRAAIQTALEGNFNIALGTGSLQNGSFTGANNTVFGVGAAALTTGTSEQNVVIGRLAGQLLGRFTAADGNTLVGYQAGYQIQAVTGGDYNTLIGHNSDGGSDITYGTALGAATSVTGASYSTAIGSGSSVATSNTIALGRNSTVDQVVIGTNTRNDTFANTKLYVNGPTFLNGDLRGTTATFTGAVTVNSLGAQRLNVGTSAGPVTNPNLIIGNGAMAGAQSGFGGNGAVGINALAANTTGYFNEAFGYNALSANTTGYSNTAVGRGALESNTIGQLNTAVGVAALSVNTTGTRNVAVGFAGLNINSSGEYNTAIGHFAGDYTETGGHNTFLGAYAAPTGVNAAILNYATAIGAYAHVSTSNTVVIGALNANKHDAAEPDDQVVIGGTARTGTYDLYVDGTIAHRGITNLSDRRIKADIQQISADEVLSRFENLNVYNYYYSDRRKLGRQIGVIAQEVLGLYPDLVNTDDPNLYSVHYDKIGVMAAAGVGRLNVRFKELDTKVNEQGTKILSLEELTGKHDKRIGALESWKTEAVGRMDTMQTAIDLNIQKIADHAVAIQTNAKAIERLDDALITLDDKVKGNTNAIDLINQRWARNFSESADGSLLTVTATELKVSNFTAQQMRANSVYTQRLEAEMARIADLEVNNLRANTAVANTVQAEQVNTGSVQVYAGVGMPAMLFAAKADGHYTVSTSSLDGSYATATVIVNAGQAKVVSGASEGIELVAEGNMVKAIAAGKSIKASWIKMG